MITLPIDSSAVLLLLGEPRPKFKDRAAGVVDVDRETNQPLVSLDLALMVTNARPQMIQVSVPQPGVGEGLTVGLPVRATGLTYISGEKNGRHWEIFRADAVASRAA